jgi:nucleoside-diphosphate-sugar epimerase
MNILITGGRGFVGSATIAHLEHVKKHTISKDGQFELNWHVYDLMDGHDIRDRSQLTDYVIQHDIDRILHLAAIARFADADKDPLLAWDINVSGTQTVVSVAEEFHLPLVFASTGSAIMPLDEFEPPYAENIPARGNSVYGCSKAVGEKIVARHTPHIILRYAHLYGPEKRFHGLVGGFLDRISRGLAPKLYGGRQSNDFTYIADVARANWLALSAPWDKWNQVYHVGTGQELSAEEAGRIICDVLDYEGAIEKLPARTVDPGRFVFDVRKAEMMLGFKAKYDFERGLVEMFRPAKGINVEAFMRD